MISPGSAPRRRAGQHMSFRDARVATSIDVIRNSSPADTKPERAPHAPALIRGTSPSNPPAVGPDPIRARVRAGSPIGQAVLVVVEYRFEDVGVEGDAVERASADGVELVGLGAVASCRAGGSVDLDHPFLLLEEVSSQAGRRSCRCLRWPRRGVRARGRGRRRASGDTRTHRWVARWR